MKTYNIRGYRECDSCAKKPGSPTLCSGCFNNRGAIADRDTIIAELGKKLGIINDIIEL